MVFPDRCAASVLLTIVLFALALAIVCVARGHPPSDEISILICRPVIRGHQVVGIVPPSRM